jgi:uncharacterized iron-regulated membrane protein
VERQLHHSLHLAALSFIDRPQSVFVRRALFQVHLWLGVITGLYILVVCATGAALVFRIDMQRALHPDLFTPSAHGPPADLLAIMNSVTRAYPGETLSGIDAPTTARPTYLAYTSSGDRFRTLLLDPVAATMLGELRDTSFVRTLQDLHFDLLGGRTGRIVNGIGAAILALMCVTGLIIWWPGRSNWRRSLVIDVRRNWARINWDLHSALGFWTVTLVLMWAVTGVYFAFPSAFRSTVNMLSPITRAQTPQSGARDGRDALSWGALVDEAQRHVPGQHVARVIVPGSEKAAFLVQFSPVRPTPLGADLFSVYLDQYSGAVLTQAPETRRTAGDVIMAWVAPLHVGNFGGMGIRIAWLVLGLAPPLLFMTGFMMWWTRVVRTRWIKGRPTSGTAANSLDRVVRVGLRRSRST